MSIPKSEIFSRLIAQTTPDLMQDLLADGITRFGGSPLKIILDGREIDFWSEFVRVDRGNGRSLVFRVITNIHTDLDIEETLFTKGIRALLQDSSQNRVITVDHRSNIEREVEPGSPESGFKQKLKLEETYKKILSGEISIFLTPIREGSLGPTKSIENIGPFSKAELKNDPNVWDIMEEVQVARLINLALSGVDPIQLFERLRSQIANLYHLFANPLCELLNGKLQFMDLSELPSSVSTMDVDPNFFTDLEMFKNIDLGFGSRKVEQVIAYPYPTAHGIIYVRLFRVWNVSGNEYEVVRVL